MTSAIGREPLPTLNMFPTAGANLGREAHDGDNSVCNSTISPNKHLDAFFKYREERGP